jgi:predicted RNase H-like HicB family nuclease
MEARESVKGWKRRLEKMQGSNKMIMKTTRRKIGMIVEKTVTGFSAYSDDYPIFTTGRTITELMDNAYEATNLYFEEEKIQITHENLKFEIDFKQFFQYYKVLNSKFLADKIGMNPTLLSQYVQGHKKPSESQTEKILTGIHQIGKELSEINLIYRK